jgi:hypothetical protein
MIGADAFTRHYRDTGLMLGVLARTLKKVQTRDWLLGTSSRNQGHASACWQVSGCMLLAGVARRHMQGDRWEQL